MNVNKKSIAFKITCIFHQKSLFFLPDTECTSFIGRHRKQPRSISWHVSFYEL